MPPSPASAAQGDELGRLVHKAAGAPQQEPVQPAPQPVAEDAGYAYPPLSLFQNRRRQTRAISKPSCATMQTCW